ncbi:DUF47 domain-containing protein [Lactovum odontotermitis]
MARKKQYNYFLALEKLAEYSVKSAGLLQELILEYNKEKFLSKSEEIHQFENEGDSITEETSNELYDAFITPIDREDIVEITNRLDDILDGINATTYSFENLQIRRLKADTDTFVQLVVTATEGVLRATKEFAKFKNSKLLKEYIHQVKVTESEADRLYSALIQRLFTSEKDPVEIIKWKDIYERLEKIMNACEEAAVVIEGLVIKNT